MTDASSPKRLRCVACEAIRREMECVAADSLNTVELAFLPMSLHEAPGAELRARLQEFADQATPDSCDAVLIGYGLCNRGLTGLRADAVPLVVPRAYDCFTLLLGGLKPYRAYFDTHPGVYFRTQGWMENDPAAQGSIRAQARRQRSLFRDFDTLARRYGEDNARHIFDTLGNPPGRHTGETFIETGCEPDGRFEEAARDEAAANGRTFEKIAADLSLLRRLVDGPWSDREFLVVSSGQAVAASFDDRVIRVESPG